MMFCVYNYAKLEWMLYILRKMTLKICFKYLFLFKIGVFQAILIYTHMSLSFIRIAEVYFFKATVLNI